MNSYLIVSILGQYNSGFIKDFTKNAKTNGCNIILSRMINFGIEFGIQMLITGTWSGVAKFEVQLPKIEKKFDMLITHRRTDEPEHIEQYSPYVIDIVSIDKPGILSKLIEFLVKKNIIINEFNSNSYTAKTNSKMSNLNIYLKVPEKVHIATFRDDFMAYCEEHNLDATLEPQRD